MPSTIRHPAVEDLQARMKQALKDARAAMRESEAREVSEAKQTLELLKKPELARITGMKERLAEINAATKLRLKEIEARKTTDNIAFTDIEKAIDMLLQPTHPIQEHTDR
jgi:hypothetical protein